MRQAKADAKTHHVFPVRKRIPYMVTKRQNWLLKFGVLAIVNPSLIMLSLAAGGPAKETKVTPSKPTKTATRSVSNSARTSSKVSGKSGQLSIKVDINPASRKPEGQERKVLGRISAEQRKAAAAAMRAARAERRGPAQVGAPGPGGQPDYFGTTPNYANSPLPQFDAQGNHIAGTGIRKFVDTLPGLGPSHANNLGKYISVAQPIPNSAYPNDDYYEIGVEDFQHQWSTDLPPTSQVRGYRDLNPLSDGQPHYLGPFIFAEADKPVRLKFVNNLGLGSAGNLFLPVDKTLMGAGDGPLQKGVDAQGNPVYEQYTENRALIHLHGGKTPWISDGTPHQWIVPKGDPTPYKRGVSARNVPDMTDPGDGAMTYYFTNQQNARQMFYHDHTSGMTRLNFYAGEASGYMITDQYEKDLIDGTNLSGINPGLKQVLPTSNDEHRYGIPLVIADKTFVPDAAQLAATDPTWNWGPMGNLWYPHVYMPNQNPYDISGANGMGRYDWGQWFWPSFPSKVGAKPNPYYGAPGEPPMMPGVPHPSAVPEAFMDVMTVNGTAFPTMPVDRKAYRFRILNASTERYVNLQLYYIDPAHPTEIKMLPADPHGPNDAIPLSTPGMTGFGVGFTNTTLNPDGTISDNGTGLPAGTWPDTWPTDGRDGGVPDPTTAGPAWIQIGNEAGFLPKPVVIPTTPFGYEYMRRTIVVLNNSTHSLWVGPAERADVIVDFSQVPAGSKIIMYNDAAAPLPGFDARLDYYTGNPDQQDTGGAPSTVEGFAPNTRTIMRFEVNPDTNVPAAAPINVGDLTPLIQAAHTASQPAPIVPQSMYNDARGQNYTDTFSSINATSLTFTPLDEKTGAPTGPAITTKMEPKAIQELFELQYGRMNATLGVEMPFTTYATQVTVPLGYFDPTTENMSDDKVQIWKVTHNGVDSHVMHFHLFDVQIVNRVGWDGAVTWPEANELGWKESIKMHPLQDCIVAMRPKHMYLPFALPDNVRPLDPTKAVGAQIEVQDLSGAGPITITNANTNFMWDYAWHCHLLGHEENDMMRPVSVAVSKTAPVAPTGASATVVASGVEVSWSDSASVNWNYRVERNAGARASGGGLLWSVVATVPKGTTTWIDKDPTIGGTVQYRISAINGGGESAKATCSTSVTSSVRLANLTAYASPLSSSAPSVQLYWTNNSPGATGIVVERATNRTFTANVVDVTANGLSSDMVDSTVAARTTYYYRIKSADSNTWVGPVVVTTEGQLPSVISGVTATAAASTTAAPSINLTWNLGSNPYPLTALMIQRATDANFTANLNTISLATNATSYTDTPLAIQTKYYYRLASSNQYGMADYSTTVSATTGVQLPAAPSNFAATPATPGTGTTSNVQLTWVDNASNETGFEVQRATNSAFTTGLTTLTAGANATSLNNNNLPLNATYYYRVRAVAAGGAQSAWSNVAGPVTTAQRVGVAPTGVRLATAAAGSNPMTVTVTWTNPAQAAGINPTGITIQRATDAAFTANVTSFAAASATATSYVDSTVSGSTRYYYRLATVNIAGVGPWSTSANITTPVAVAGSPVASAVNVPISTNAPSIVVNWTATPPAGVTGFVIQRARNTQFTTNMVQTSVSGAAMRTYSDTGLGANTTYYYRVAMVSPLGNSAWSNRVTITSVGQLPGQVTGLTLNGTVTTTSAPIRWTAVAGATSYDYQFSSGAGVLAGTATGTTATRTGLTRGTTYTVQVRARNTSGTGAWSAPLTVTTAP